MKLRIAVTIALLLLVVSQVYQLQEILVSNKTYIALEPYYKNEPKQILILDNDKKWHAGIEIFIIIGATASLIQVWRKDKKTYK